MRRSGFHTFNGPERDLWPAGAPTNHGQRPVTTDRRWGVHRDFKVDRAPHTKVQYNGMKYQKGMKPPPKEALVQSGVEGGQPVSRGFVPSVKSRPSTMQHHRRKSKQHTFQDLLARSSSSRGARNGGGSRRQGRRSQQPAATKSNQQHQSNQHHNYRRRNSGASPTVSPNRRQLRTKAVTPSGRVSPTHTLRGVYAAS